jgi:hypothetical protein
MPGAVGGDHLRQVLLALPQHTLTCLCPRYRLRNTADHIGIGNSDTPLGLAQLLFRELSSICVRAQAFIRVARVVRGW